MFESLQEKIGKVFKVLRGLGKISEKNITDALKEVRLALLEADVNFKVVKELTENIKVKALGKEVLDSVSPGQQFIKIVHDELVNTLGGTLAKINISPVPPTKILLVGLQGSGKTTMCAKLANHFKRQGHRPLLVGVDVYRPAAMDQLAVLAKQTDVPVHVDKDSKDPVAICRQAMTVAKDAGYNIIIVDTAGRLHVDDTMMDEVIRIKKEFQPTETLFIVDSMTGQDAVNTSKAFNEAVGFDGVILTKLDGDTRGGAAISIRAVTGKPIKFAGVGEKMDAIEPFHPDRLAGRILGMGDIVSLVEKAQEQIDVKKMEEMEKRLLKEDFNLQDFVEQLRQVKKMGPIENILGMIPGFGNASKMKDVKIEDNVLTRIEAIINSMTVKERLKPNILDGSRKRRISKGSGTTVEDVNNLLKQFSKTKEMMRKMQGMMKGKSMPFPF